MLDKSSISITRSMRSSISIQIKPDGSILVKAPVFMTESSIYKFIDSKSDWLEKHTKKIQSHSSAKHKQYIPGEHFLFLGESVPLTIGDYKEISVKRGKLYYPDFLQFRIKTELKNWYIKQAREVITDRVKANAVVMKASYKSISFSDTKSKWGSCTHDNHLQFCWRLIMAPLIVINYVVIHELVHTTVKNHSEDFWRRVRFYNPSCKQQVKWLKEYGDTLVLS